MTELGCLLELRLGGQRFANSRLTMRQIDLSIAASTCQLMNGRHKLTFTYMKPGETDVTSH